ncbi:MAG: pantetheine-phosphate adenylyltransferase [Verrucomicrobiota bacterium]
MSESDTAAEKPTNVHVVRKAIPTSRIDRKSNKQRILLVQNPPVMGSTVMRTAVYAGSFDPPTNGHLWMIRRGLDVFDRLIVAIGDNPAKRYSFTVEERLEMLRESAPDEAHLEIAHFDNRFLVDYAKKKKAAFILRGIRSPGDYEFEKIMRQINADMAPDITTIFLMPPRDIAEVSSNMVKGLIGPAGWESIVSRYVPESVFQRIVRSAETGRTFA